LINFNTATFIVRKNFLLIVYVTLFLFTQRGAGAAYDKAFEENSNNSPSLISNSIHQSDELSVYRESGFFISDIDQEDDGEVKAKAISSGSLFQWQAFLQFLNQSELAGYPVPHHPRPLRSLFKLNQVFRL
jgi:hypothetical protein